MVWLRETSSAIITIDMEVGRKFPSYAKFLFAGYCAIVYSHTLYIHTWMACYKGKKALYMLLFMLSDTYVASL